MSLTLVEKLMEMGKRRTEDPVVLQSHTDEALFNRMLELKVGGILGEFAEGLAWRSRLDRNKRLRAVAPLEGSEVYLKFASDLSGKYVLEACFDNGPGQHVDHYPVHRPEDLALFVYYNR